MDLNKFEAFVSQYPIYEYRILSAEEIHTYPRVREICRTECERYGSTWACPPATGTVEECEKRIHSYSQGILFSSVAEVSDLLNMKEMLATRRAHEDLSTAVGEYMKEQGYEVLILSTESCDLCGECAYKKGEPCVHPERMHPCLESHGVVVYDLAVEHGMDYQLDGNVILWFSLVMFREKSGGKKPTERTSDDDEQHN